MKTLGAFEGVSVDQMYREHLLDHYKNPHNLGRIQGAEHFHDVNPLCGDEIEMFVVFASGTIKKVMFDGKGCALSQATASILTDEIQGKSFDFVRTLDKEKIQEIVGVKVAPMRVKCMMLPVKVLKTIVYLHEGQKLKGDEE